MDAPFFSSTTSEPFDRGIGQEFPRMTENVVVLSGQVQPQYALMGRITASQKWKLSASAAGDGSEIPRGLLVTAVDATGGDKIASVFTTGAFAKIEVTLGAGHTLASVADVLRDAGIHLKDVVPG